MKQYYFLFVLFFGLLSSQQIKVVDSENGSPVPNAKIILPNGVFYSNDDGIAPVSQNSKSYEISASGYKTEKLKNFKSLVQLKPIYRDIEEVKIVSVDIRKIIEDVSKNYPKRYYSQPSLYDVTWKQKAFDNNKLSFLVIAEAKLWSKNNSYNFKDGFRKNYDEILQMQLNNVKYLKNVKSDSIFSGQSSEFSHETIGNYFLSFELYRTLQNIKSKDSKYSGNLIFEEGDEQVIVFKIHPKNGVKVEGEFKYNKADKVIHYFKATYFQTDYPTYKRKTDDGREFDYKLGDASIIFDFYKKDGSYIPTLNVLKADNFTVFYKDEIHVKKFSREIIYNTFSKSDKNGIDPKVDFNKSIWKNAPVKEEKENTMLLSKEEQAFINEK